MLCEPQRTLRFPGYPPWLWDAHLVRPMCATWGKVVRSYFTHFHTSKYGRFPNRTLYLQNVPTRHWYHSYIFRYTNKKLMSHFLLYTHNAPQSSYFRRLSHRSRKLAHQREVAECLVGTFCKYNVLLGNLPLDYRMFPPDIDRQSKLNLIGGGGEL